jgi:4-amino-4-deoxychorismate lyase
MKMNHPILINGSFNAAISALDRGFAYGDGVFRTIKVVNGIPEHWPLHYQTLVKDCSALGIVCPSADLLMNDFERLATAEDTKSVVKVIVTRGEGERGYKPPAITAPNRVMIKSSFPSYPNANSITGVKLHLCETRISHQPKLAGIKHLNRLENVLARMEWQEPNIAEGLMLDNVGHVIECTAANIFARFGKTLVTPKLDLCGVAGITRQQILCHANSLNFKPSVETIQLNQLLEADEVIICNSLFGVWQVVELAEKKWSKQDLDKTIMKAIS